MFSMIHNKLKPMTYWPPVERNKYNEIGPVDPVEVKGYWIDKKELIGGGINAEGQVYLCCNVTIENEGYLYNGVSTSTTPHELDGAEKVVMIRELNDLNSNTRFYKAWV
jgi:hypothetical protein